MTIPALHPESTDDPDLVRWKTNATRLAGLPPQLTALIDNGVLDRVEIDVDEVRTWLGDNRSWSTDGPAVRRALLEALRAAQGAELTDAELHTRIEEILAREVAPIAQSHGGGVRVESVRDGVLTVELTGACSGCSESERTVGKLVTHAVQQRYSDIREVKAVRPRPVWLSLSRRRGGRGDSIA